MNLPEDPSNLGYDFIEDDDNERTKKFNFMTTVSIPVYDKRENAVSSFRIFLDLKKLDKVKYGDLEHQIGKNSNAIPT